MHCNVSYKVSYKVDHIVYSYCGKLTAGTIVHIGVRSTDLVRSTQGTVVQNPLVFQLRGTNSLKTKRTSKLKDARHTGFGRLNETANNPAFPYTVLSFSTQKLCFLFQLRN